MRYKLYLVEGDRELGIEDNEATVREFLIDFFGMLRKLYPNKDWMRRVLLEVLEEVYR